MKDANNITCPNCRTVLLGPVCHQCGQRHHEDRWTTKVLIGQFIEQVTNIERGFLYTARSLFVTPGKLIHDYWQRSTVLTYNPFRYFLILIAINILINFWLGIDDLLEEYLTPTFVEDQYGRETLDLADQKLDTWFNALILLMLPVFGFITKWLFSKHSNNYAEHLILNSFIMGQQALITSFTHFIFFFIPSLFAIFLIFNFLVGLVYNTYVFKQVFREGIWQTMGKAFIMGVIGLIVYFAIIAGASVIALALS